MLAGVLVDISSAMASAVQLDFQLEEQTVTRIQSILSTVIRTLQREVLFRRNQEIFMLVYGLKDINTCDLLSLLGDIGRLDREYNTTGRACLTQLMARSAAPYTGRYIEKYLSQQAAGALFETFTQNQSS